MKGLLKEIKYNQKLFHSSKKSGNKKKWIEDRIQLEPNQRIDICNECKELTKLTRQCKLCFCFMDVKTKLKNKFCPKGKW